jgi:simple sugar transport system ATP-binding protein
VSERRSAGLAHIPEDRHRRGLILDYSIADNLLLGRQDTFASRGVLDTDRIDENASTQIKSFDIRPPSAILPARALSGGNQQKVVIAREMGHDFTVLLASQPYSRRRRRRHRVHSRADCVPHEPTTKPSCSCQQS